MVEESNPFDIPFVATPTVKERELTVRELKFMDGLVQGKPARHAAVDAGYGDGSLQSASASASRKLNTDVNFRRELTARLVEAGLDAPGITRKLKDLLESKQYGLSREGVSVELGPDGHAQNKAMDMVLKVVGAYPDPRAVVDLAGAQIIYMRPENQLTSSDGWSEVIDVTPIESNVATREDGSLGEDSQGGRDSSG